MTYSNRVRFLSSIVLSTCKKYVYFHMVISKHVKF